MLLQSWVQVSLACGLQTEEQLKKRVGAKLEVARFLQDTVSEMAKDMRTTKTGATQASAADLYQFMKRVSRQKPLLFTSPVCLSYSHTFCSQLHFACAIHET